MSMQPGRRQEMRSSPKSKRELQREALALSIRPVIESLEQRQLLTVNTAGLLDPTLNTSGFNSTAFGPSSNKAQAIAVDSLGYVLVGSSSTGSAELAQFSSNGSLTWSTSTAASTFGGNVVLNAVAIDASGNIVVAGQETKTGQSADFFVARYTSAGTLDTTFGPASQGFNTTDFNSDTDTGTSIAIDGSGNIYVAGTVTISGTGEFGIAKYSSSGAFVSQANEAVGTGAAQANAMVLDGSNLVVAGSAMDGGSDTDFAVQLFNTSLTAGTTTFTDISGSGSTDSANAIAVIPASGGNVVVAGDSAGKVTLAEYNSSGVYQFNVTTSTAAAVTGVAVQPGGAIVVAGTGTSGSNKTVVLARFIPSGGKRHPRHVIRIRRDRNLDLLLAAIFQCEQRGQRSHG